MHPRTVKVLETLTGRELWTYTAPRDIEIRLDASGTVLTLIDAEQTVIAEIPAGRLIATEGPGFWTPGRLGQYLIRSRQPLPGASNFGYTLFQRSHGPLVDLSLDRDAADPQFSLDGNLLAHGNPDGSVFLHDLAAIQNRLASIGLGW
jgi:hypothetical protein